MNWISYLPTLEKLEPLERIYHEFIGKVVLNSF